MLHLLVWTYRSPLLLMTLMAIGSIQAMDQPEFTTSTITPSSKAPLEGDPLYFTIVLRNSGSIPAENAQLTIEWPLMGYLIDVSGLEEAKIDQESRKISATISLAALSNQTVSLRVLAPRHSGGDVLSVSVNLQHFSSGAELWEHQSVVVSSRFQLWYSDWLIQDHGCRNWRDPVGRRQRFVLADFSRSQKSHRARDETGRQKKSGRQSTVVRSQDNGRRHHAACGLLGHFCRTRLARSADLD